jgi:hypothetical protein
MITPDKKAAQRSRAAPLNVAMLNLATADTARQRRTTDEAAALATEVRSTQRTV